MINIKKHLNKLSVKVAVVIILLVAGLLVTLNFAVVNRGERTFVDIYGILRERGELPPNDEPFIFPPPGDHFQIFNIYPNDAQLTPGQHFTNRFQSSLLIIGLVALVVAVGLGWLISLIVARPLKKLGAGIEKLRESHYRLRLEENDSEEFNELIHEFNSLAEELQRTEELRKNLISDTSHELKTPLTSLIGQLEGIEDGVFAVDAARIRLLREQVNRLGELTEGLQEYARLRSQAFKPHLTSFPLKNVINKLSEQFHQRLEEKHISVVSKIADDYSLTADQALVERMFANLFENALRYSQAKAITVTADKGHLTFADDGVGIPPEHLKDIFERFFRLEKSRSRETGGLGLGLSIVREIIEAHGWKINAKTPDNNKGVMFVVDLI